MDGCALFRVLQNPLARPTPLRILVLTLPFGLLRIGTWGALGLELGFAPLALLRKARPLIWVAMVALHCSLVLLVNFADVTMGMLLLHLFTFDPQWIRPKRAAAGTEMVFYDGHCGLCHRAVRFVLAEDRAGNTFRFSALQGELFAQSVAPSDRRCKASSSPKVWRRWIESCCQIVLWYAQRNALSFRGQRLCCTSCQGWAGCGGSSPVRGFWCLKVCGTTSTTSLQMLDTACSALQPKRVRLCREN